MPISVLCSLLMNVIDGGLQHLASTGADTDQCIGLLHLKICGFIQKDLFSRLNAVIIFVTFFYSSVKNVLCAMF